MLRLLAYDSCHQLVNIIFESNKQRVKWSYVIPEVSTTCKIQRRENVKLDHEFSAKFLNDLWHVTPKNIELVI